MSDALIASLRRPEAYPWPVVAVEVIETHISWVFLAGERVVKVKRPVGYSFVDYTTLAKRRAACEDEVRLNRRLSDDIYLGIVPITRDEDALRVDGEGDIVEWATLMRRLAADRMLDVALRAGDAIPDLADRLADRLVPFHLCAPRCEGDDLTVSAAMTAVVTDNLEELAPFRGSPLASGELDLVTRAIRRFVAARGELLLARVRDGWIREGHGDLRCEHVALGTGAPQVFDCVEFNRGLRCADVASDLAFLLMDLARLGAPEGTVGRALERYRAAGIELPVALLRFYWAHRALVRAKVACLRYAPAEADEAVALATKATERLHMAAMQALTTRPAMVVMTGLSGSGKSTVARALARVLGARQVVADVVRKGLAGASGRSDAAWGEGIYTRAWTEATYSRMIALGAEAIRAGHPVVLDGTFLDDALRRRAAAAARECGAPFALVETVCDDAVVERRIEARKRGGASLSDAGVEVYRRQRARFLASPLAVPEGAIVVTIDTSADGPASLDPALAALEAAGVVEARIREDGTLVADDDPEQL